MSIEDLEDERPRRPAADPDAGPRAPRTPAPLEDLTDRATPIDFPDLERRGILQKAPHEKGWYLVLKPAELPAYAREQATWAGQTRIGGRWMPMLKFSKSTNRKAAALLATFPRRLVRPRDVMAH